MGESTKIVYNTCYGGFSLSYEAVLRLAEKKGIKVYPQKLMSDCYIYWLEPLKENEDRRTGPTFDVDDLGRSDPDMIDVVEEMGELANGMCAKLRIEEIPKGTLYQISEYDGYESIKFKDDDIWSVA